MLQVKPWRLESSVQIEGPQRCRLPGVDQGSVGTCVLEWALLLTTRNSSNYWNTSYLHNTSATAFRAFDS